jgi:hypothetical protein
VRLVPVVNEAIRRVSQSRSQNPKTILAFYATVLGLTLTADVAVVAVLASTDVLTGLIPWLLGFAGLMSLALMVAVFVIALKDPSKLMLGQVSGTEYVEIQRLSVDAGRATEQIAPQLEQVKRAIEREGRGRIEE